MSENEVKALVVVATVMLVVALFTLLAGLAIRNAVVCMSGVAALALGCFMMAVATDQNTQVREECGVVGTTADDATYVCVEVTE